MRLLFVAAHLKKGGVERQWSFLLPGLRDAGFEVSLLTLTAEGDFFPSVQEAGVPSTCARMRNRTDLAGIRRALAHSKWSPDIVVTNSVLGHVVGHLLARKAGAQHIATEHGAGRLASDRPSHDPLRRLIASRVEGVIAVTGKQIRYLTGLGYRRERIHVVWSGIPDIHASRERSEVRAELGLASGDFAAMLIAVLRPEKRADLFIRAISRARTQDGRIRGFIAGKGPLLASLKNQAQATDGAVMVLGDRSDVPDLMIAADVVCLTSESEAVPMVLIEAMALGRPIVATNVGGISEAVVQRQTGILVPPGDDAALVGVLLEVAENRSQLEALGARGRERQQELFTVDRMVREYGKVFEEFMANGRGRRGSR